MILALSQKIDLDHVFEAWKSYVYLSEKDIALAASSANSNTFDRDGLSPSKVELTPSAMSSCEDEDERGEDAITTILNVAIPIRDWSYTRRLSASYYRGVYQDEQSTIERTRRHGLVRHAFSRSHTNSACGQFTKL
ncbi:hypothetical protein OGZ01_24045 [Vibrio harveyi]|nr:hypothetical protein [Vibrio harveyi]